LTNKDIFSNSVTIVIPVKNEEGNIINILQLIKQRVKISYNVIVVDGCSTDQTFNLTKDYIKKNKCIRIIKTRPEDSAFKESLEVGINASKTEFVAIMMGDLSDNPTTLNEMYKIAEMGSDVVIGSRYMRGGRIINKPFIQKYLSWIVNKFFYLLTGIPTHDVSNPYALYRKKYLDLKKTISIGFEIPLEMLYKAYFKGAKISEVPTVWEGRVNGKSKFTYLRYSTGFAKICTWVLINNLKFNLIKQIKS